jgi:hypothetical protein
MSNRRKVAKEDKKILKEKQKYMELLRKATRKIDKAASLIIDFGPLNEERKTTLEELNQSRTLAAKALNRMPDVFAGRTRVFAQR